MPALLRDRRQPTRMAASWRGALPRTRPGRNQLASRLGLTERPHRHHCNAFLIESALEAEATCPDGYHPERGSPNHGAPNQCCLMPSHQLQGPYSILSSTQDFQALVGCMQ
jgi:hypothetical protein